MEDIYKIELEMIEKAKNHVKRLNEAIENMYRCLGSSPAINDPIDEANHYLSIASNNLFKILDNEFLQLENKALKEKIKTMEKEIDDLRDAWNNEINLNSASENNDLLCPSCGHNLQCFDCGDLF